MMAADTWRLLSHLHRGGAWGYWWTPDGETFTGKDGLEHRAKVSRWYPIGERCGIPAAWADKNVYWGVHPCTAIPPTNSRGEERKPHQVRAQIPYIAAINCLFAEFDGGADDALTHLEDLPYYPTAVIHSGGGLHCYWCLEFTQLVTDANRAEIDHIQKSWVHMVGSDDGAKDLARVLRVPGTRNYKPERRRPDGTYPTVEIVEYFPYRLYDLGRLAALLPPYRPPDPKPAAVAAPSGAAGHGSGGAGAIRWAYANLQTGSRHERARWLACALRDNGVSQFAAKAELERFKDAANRLGGRQLDSGEMAGIVAWAYGKGA
jgi:hypothetical protein